MIHITDKSKCCGCSACMVACPKKCIELRKDNEGFLYPFIDVSLCIECGLCKKKCPVLLKDKIKDDSRRVFAAVNKNIEIKEKSSSGGIFSLLATNIINNGGCVFGAALSKDCYSVEHVMVDAEEGLNKLRGSKYVQSNIGNCFQNIKESLDKGYLTMFSGTPCQVAGLKSFLDKDYNNLITLDLICHGVPSPKVWEAYIKYKEKQYRKKAKYVNFRYKCKNATTYSLQIIFEDDEIYCRDKNTDIYLRGYISDLFLRPSCYDCKFKGLDRHSDITLADFWGIEKYDPDFSSGFGVSLLSVHSQKGMELFKKISSDMVYKEFDDLPVIENSCSIKSTPKPVKRDEFMNNFLKNGVEQMRQFDFPPTIKLKMLIKKFLNDILKK